MVKNVVVHLKIVISRDTFKFFKLVNAINSGKRKVLTYLYLLIKLLNYILSWLVTKQAI